MVIERVQGLSWVCSSGFMCIAAQWTRTRWHTCHLPHNSQKNKQMMIYYFFWCFHFNGESAVCQWSLVIGHLSRALTLPERTRVRAWSSGRSHLTSRKMGKASHEPTDSLNVILLLYCCLKSTFPLCVDVDMNEADPFRGPASRKRHLQNMFSS